MLFGEDEGIGAIEEQYLNSDEMVSIFDVTRGGKACDGGVGNSTRIAIAWQLNA